jgi:hypothetical protein
MQSTIVRHLNQLAAERWTRQAIRTLLRAAWAALCMWCIVVGASLVFAWPVDLDIAGALALLVVGVVLVQLLFRRAMPASAVARRFDRRFRLNEELATAVEVASQNPPANSLAAALLERSSQTLRQVRRQIRTRQSAPWSEIIALLALLLIAAGLFVMIGIGRPLPTAEEQPLPPLAGDAAQQQADEPIDDAPRDAPGPGLGAGQPIDDAPSGTGQASGQGQNGGQSQSGTQAQGGQQGQTGDQNQASAPTSPQRRRELDAIADALRDQGITRPAAEALDRGDAAGAAQDLRELADSASAISPQARGELADALRDAARQIEQTNPDLAQQLRDSARGLERGDDNAAQGLEDLARALESMQAGAQAGQNTGQAQGDQPAQGNGGGQEGQGEGDQSGSGGGAGNVGASEQRPVQPAPRLDVDGQPVELDSTGDGSIPARPSDQATVASGGAIGSVSGGSGGTTRDGSGSDPLRVPADERDVVQDYFTP